MHTQFATLARTAIVIRKVRGTGAALWRGTYATASNAAAAVPNVFAHVIDCLPYLLMGALLLLYGLFAPGMAAGGDVTVAALAIGATATVKATPGTRTDKQVVHVADIVRHGTAITIPDTMTYKAAAEALLRKEIADEEMTMVSRQFNIFPWEGAIALAKAAAKLFGLPLNGEAVESFFSTTPPRLIQVEVGPDGETVSVPWGKFSFVGADPGEAIYTGADRNPETGALRFTVTAEVKRKHMAMIEQLLVETERLAVAESIYRGKALRVQFTDDDGDTLMEPVVKFLKVSDVDPKGVVFNRDVEDIIGANVFDHIRHRKALAQLGVPFKLGVLFAGKYGTGKSLVARAIARVATDCGVTFLYLKKSEELHVALTFAMQYQPCVVFAEDVDRVVGGDDDDTTGRSQEVSQIVNLLDGIDSKTTDVMTVLTTNHLDRINKVLLRPGRIDLAVHIDLPDVHAIERLIHLYSRDAQLAPDANVRSAAQLLVGQVPAVIREVVERAKRFMVSRTHGDIAADVLASDIELAALTVVQQARLVEGEKAPRELSDGEHIRAGLVELGKGLSDLAAAAALPVGGVAWDGLSLGDGDDVEWDDLTPEQREILAEMDDRLERQLTAGDRVMLGD
jgi:hypothetical protein